MARRTVGVRGCLLGQWGIGVRLDRGWGSVARVSGGLGVSPFPVAGLAARAVGLEPTLRGPAAAGRLLGHGRVVHRGKTIAFLEGTLSDPDGQLLATATSTVRIVKR